MDLSCDWNFTLYMCIKKDRKCSKATSDGAAVIHGTSYSFSRNGPEKKFHVSFTIECSLFEYIELVFYQFYIHNRLADSTVY